jgi:hypothetical protein
MSVDSQIPGGPSPSQGLPPRDSPPSGVVPAAPGTQLRGLVLLCGSHIRESKRISTLLETLESWRLQTAQVPFWLSISFESDSLASETLPVLRFYGQISQFRFSIQTSPFKQFRHYSFLVNELRASISTAMEVWIAFVDDDDTLEPCRMECFEALITESSTIKHRPFVQIKSDPALPELPTDGLDTKINTANEYFEFSIELSAFEFFLKQCPSQIIESVFVDCFLVKYLRTLDFSIPECWVAIEHQPDIGYNYWYRSAYFEYENKHHVDNEDRLERQLLLFISRTHLDLSVGRFLQWLRNQSVLPLSTHSTTNDLVSLTQRLSRLFQSRRIREALQMPTLTNYYKMNPSRQLSPSDTGGRLQMGFTNLQCQI